MLKISKLSRRNSFFTNIAIAVLIIASYTPVCYSARQIVVYCRDDTYLRGQCRHTNIKSVNMHEASYTYMVYQGVMEMKY